MNSGELDRRVTIEKRTLTKDAAGGSVETWSASAKAWAKRMDKSGKESEVADGDKAQISVSWKIRFMKSLQGVNGASGYRIAYGGMKFDIAQVAEIGRREYMLLKTTATEGLA